MSAAEPGSIKLHSVWWSPTSVMRVTVRPGVSPYPSLPFVYTMGGNDAAGPADVTHITLGAFLADLIETIHAAAARAEAHRPLTVDPRAVWTLPNLLGLIRILEDEAMFMCERG